MEPAAAPRMVSGDSMGAAPLPLIGICLFSKFTEERGGFSLLITFGLESFLTTIPLEQNWLCSKLIGNSYSKILLVVTY